MRPMTMPPMRGPDCIHDGLADGGRAPRRYAPSVALQGKMRDVRSFGSMSEAISSSCERTCDWALGASAPVPGPSLRQLLLYLLALRLERLARRRPLPCRPAEAGA